jgi:uncharacterized membrane protein YfcA
MLIGVGLLGLFIGALTGLLGAGGGILAVPSLVYLVGIPLGTAIPTSLVMGAVGPVAALLPRLRAGVQWQTVLAVSAAGIPAAFVGTLAGASLPENVVLLAFAVLMFAAGIQMLRRRPRNKDIGVRPRLWLVRGLAVGVLVGFLTGLLGIGGGFITVPALMLMLGLPIGLAIGSSLVIAIINSLAGIIAHAGTTSPDWAVAVAFVVPSMAAALISAQLSKRVSGNVLQRSFAILVVVVAVITIIRVLLSTTSS